MSGGLESVAAAQDDTLIPGLTFKLPQGAAYVSGRKFSTFYPQGSNIYSSTGTRLLRFVLSDANHLLDLSTFRLAYQLKNDDGTNGLWISGHAGMSVFQRIRVYIGGTLVEDIMYSNKIASMFDVLKPADRRWAEKIEMNPGSSDVATGTYNSSFLGGPPVRVIPPGQQQTVLTKIFAGLFDSHILLPGKFPLTLELEMVSSPTQCCLAGVPGGGTASQAFSLSNARILCDVVSVDNVVMEELNKVLLAGGALPIHICTYSTTLHQLVLNPPAIGTPAPANPSVSWAITLSRAFSRIKDIWQTFESDGALTGYFTQSNCFLNPHGVSNANWGNYSATTQYNPTNGEGWRHQIQTGSLLYPEIPMSSVQEAYYNLSKCLGMHSSMVSPSITPAEWLDRTYIVAMDVEKMSSSPGAGGAAFTGLSTRSAGDTIRLSWENVSPRVNVNAGTGAVVDVNAWPSRCFVTLRYDAIIELRAEGVVLLD
jgi:hypothetical protein